MFKIFKFCFHIYFSAIWHYIPWYFDVHWVRGNSWISWVQPLWPKWWPWPLTQGHEKKIRLLPGIRSIFPPKIKSIRPLVSEEFADRQTHGHTDRQTSYQCYNIDYTHSYWVFFLFISLHISYSNSDMFISIPNN